MGHRIAVRVNRCGWGLRYFCGTGNQVRKVSEVVMVDPGDQVREAIEVVMVKLGSRVREANDVVRVDRQERANSMDDAELINGQVDGTVMRPRVDWDVSVRGKDNGEGHVIGGGNGGKSRQYGCACEDSMAVD